MSDYNWAARRRWAQNASSWEDAFRRWKVLEGEAKKRGWQSRTAAAAKAAALAAVVVAAEIEEEKP